MLDTDLEMISGKKRKRMHDDDFSVFPFKNVKLTGREVASENGALNSSLEPTEATIDSNLTDIDYDGIESPDEKDICVTAFHNALNGLGLWPRPSSFKNAMRYLVKVRVRLKYAATYLFNNALIYMA